MRNPDLLIELAQQMEKPLERWLKFKQVVNRYERGRDTKLGQIRSQLDKGSKTQDDFKFEVRAHEQFVKYLEEWDRAEKNMISAQVKYESLKTNFDALQSALSYDKESMKHHG